MSIGTEPKIEKAAKKSAAKKPSRHVRGHRRAIWGLRRCRSCVWARGTWKDSQVNRRLAKVNRCCTPQP